MKLKTTLVLLGCIIAASISAQQSETKQINSIKRNNQYIYAEATMATESEAYQVAEELLTVYINDYVEDKKKLSKAENIIIKDIASNCDKIQMMRGEMYRVFVYVKKSDIIPADNLITMVKPEVVEVKPEPTIALPPAQIEELPQGEPVEVADNPVESSWQQNVINELLAASTLTSAKASLNRLKVEYKVKRYGTYDECKNPNNCFWIIADNNGMIQTILGPGTQRTNFKRSEERRVGKECVSTC